jgi:hypothetical protein
MGKSSNWLPAVTINSNYDDIEVFVAMEHLFATVHRLKTEVLAQADFCRVVDQILVEAQHLSCQTVAEAAMPHSSLGFSGPLKNPSRCHRETIPAAN